MLKKALLIGVLQLLIVSAVYAAPDRTGRNDIGVDVSGAIATDSDTDSTVYVGGNLSHGITEWFAVGASFGWENFGTNDVSGGGVTIPGPDITAYPLFADFILRVPVQDSPAQPYGVVGLGAIFWDTDTVTASNGVAVNTDVDTSFGVKLGGGVDWFLNEHWVLNFNAAYVFTDADVTVSAAGTSATDKVNLDYWTVGGGLKYLF